MALWRRKRSDIKSRLSSAFDAYKSAESRYNEAYRRWLLKSVTREEYLDARNDYRFKKDAFNALEVEALRDHAEEFSAWVREKANL